ncbi:MAG TPA: hypothetical protein VHB79_02020 [Polyangiaceae bacterium]|nr:hypothetical protein [Polyangiaceae bacterium]
MAKLGLGLRSVGCCLALSLLLSAGAARADDSIPEEAKLYFKNGVELIQGQPPNYQDAYYQFKLAWEKSKSWKVLSNWGLCALKLERDGEAIWAYTEYLKQKDIDPDERKDLERDLLLLNGNAASVTLTSDVAALEVVDARAGSSVPPQSYRLDGGKLALRLRAGSHTITATSQGKSQRWEVTLSPGRTDEHRFEFGAAAPAPAPAPAAPAPVQLSPSNAPPPSDSGSSSGGGVRVAGFAVAGAGVVGLGLGTFFGLSAKSKESSVSDTCKNIDVGFRCPESQRSQYESAQSSAKLANVFLIAGGVLTAGGLVMIIVGGPKSSAPASAQLSLSPVVGPRDAGFFAQGTF